MPGITSSSTNVTVDSGAKTAIATYLGAAQVLNVTGSLYVTIRAWGAGGGAGGEGIGVVNGGGAAAGNITFAASNSDVITLYIGQSGSTGGIYGGGGGGGTFIYLNGTLLMALGAGGGGATSGADPGKGASDTTSGVSGSNNSNGGTGGNGGGGGVDAGGGAGILSNGGAGLFTQTVAQRNNPYGAGGISNAAGGTGGLGGGGNGSSGGDGGDGGGGGGYSGGGGGGSGFDAGAGGGGGSYFNNSVATGTLYAGTGEVPGGVGLTGYNGTAGYGGQLYLGIYAGNGEPGYIYVSWVDGPKQFTLTNTGSASGTINSFTFNDPASIGHTANLANLGGSSAVTGNVTGLGYTLGIGASQTFTVEYSDAGASNGTYSGNIVIGGSGSTSQTITSTINVGSSPTTTTTTTTTAGPTTTTTTTTTTAGPGTLGYVGGTAPYDYENSTGIDPPISNSTLNLSFTNQGVVAMFDLTGNSPEVNNLPTQWFTPTGGGIGASYDIKITSMTGTCTGGSRAYYNIFGGGDTVIPPGSYTLPDWISLNTNQTIIVGIGSAPIVGASTALVMQIAIAPSGDHGSAITAQFTLVIGGV
jgi:hypothetical protein